MKCFIHGLRTSGEEIAFTERPKIKSQSQIFRYGLSIFCLPHRPKFSDFFDFCLHWVSIVRGFSDIILSLAIINVAQHRDSHLQFYFHFIVVNSKKVFNVFVLFLSQANFSKVAFTLVSKLFACGSPYLIL